MTKRERDEEWESDEDLAIDVAGILRMAPLLSPIHPKGKNVVFSPISLHAVFSLIAAAAGDRAAEKLIAFLNSDSVDDLNKLSTDLVSDVLADGGDGGGPRIGFVNGLWIQKGISLKDSFKQVVENVYRAELRQVDFINKASEIEALVNSWADEKTNGLIRSIVPSGSLEPLDRLILTNALYFNGSWLDNPFEASATKDHDFHLLGGGSVKVPFMRSRLKKHHFKAYDDFKVISLSYNVPSHANKDFSMYILLPNLLDGLASLTERIASEPGFVDKIHLDLSWRVEVEKVLIPKFEISFEFSASSVLEKLGIALPKLTDMVDSASDSTSVALGDDSLYVSGIFQNAFIEVNEEGTKAAAVTRGLITGAAREKSPDVPKVFVADHPFVFLVREDCSRSLLFFGHVLNPLQN